MNRAAEQLGSRLDALIRGIEARSQSPAVALAVGVGLGLAVIAGGIATFLLVLFVLVQLFA